VVARRRTLAFVSDRDDHSFIGIFAGASQPIRYLAAVHVARLGSGVVADGRMLAFVRQPGAAGRRDSLLAQQPQPWSIVVTGLSGTASAQRPPLRRASLEKRRRTGRFRCHAPPEVPTCIGPPTTP